MSFHRYPEEEILNQIDFVMMDSTFHNLELIESLCEKFDVENFQGTLLCNIHPLMMLQGRIKELCQEIHHYLGKKELVNVSLLIWSSGMSH